MPSTVNRPSTLYHYTSLDGLKGIVENRCLWATDIAYLNDYKELRHSLELTNKLLLNRKTKAEKSPSPLNHWWSEFYKLRKTNPYIGDSRALVISLTQNGDQLSQWRGYCPSGMGVSIGFDASLFDHYCEQGRARFDRCIYDSSEKSKLIRSQISECEKALSGDGVSATSDAYISFWAELFFRGVYLKHGTFNEEKEWRFHIVQRASKGDWKYRLTPSGLIPYTEVPFLNGSLPIKEVILSPSSNAKPKAAAISRYLSSEIGSGNSTINVRLSQIPFRFR